MTYFDPSKIASQCQLIIFYESTQIKRLEKMVTQPGLAVNFLSQLGSSICHRLIEMINAGQLAELIISSFLLIIAYLICRLPSQRAFYAQLPSCLQTALTQRFEGESTHLCSSGMPGNLNLFNCFGVTSALLPFSLSLAICSA